MKETVLEKNCKNIVFYESTLNFEKLDVITSKHIAKKKKLIKLLKHDKKAITV